MAPRADENNLTKFSERAEELAEQYRRSLCTEGFSKEKAKEIAIEKKVDLCRKSARSERLQAIIAATKFSEPKEVIAKMIVEINHLKLDKNATQNTHNNTSNGRRYEQPVRYYSGNETNPENGGQNQEQSQ